MVKCPENHMTQALITHMMIVTRLVQGYDLRHQSVLVDLVVKNMSCSKEVTTLHSGTLLNNNTYRRVYRLLNLRLL
ncbi:hypothetical protein P691DRAFT_804831, partial [Macrolepiota fuliginosa MF-IS2]